MIKIIIFLILSLALLNDDVKWLSSISDLSSALKAPNMKIHTQNPMSKYNFQNQITKIRLMQKVRSKF